MLSDSGGDINRFEIVGNVGIVKIGATPRGLPITNLSVGTHRAVLNPDTHQREERTDWHDVVLFGALASTVAHTVATGARVYASGYMRKRSWESATSGKKAYRYELVATVPDTARLSLVSASRREGMPRVRRRGDRQLGAIRRRRSSGLDSV